MGPTFQPNGLAPRSNTSAIGPMNLRSGISTWSAASTRSKYGDIASIDRWSEPISSHQRWWIHGGGRRQVPPFTAVDPPTSLPLSTVTGEVPSVNVFLMYVVWARTKLPTNSVRLRRLPSSTSTTAWP